jgi:hypothetical protein
MSSQRHSTLPLIGSPYTGCASVGPRRARKARPRQQRSGKGAGPPEVGAAASLAALPDSDGQGDDSNGDSDDYGSAHDAGLSAGTPPGSTRAFGGEGDGRRLPPLYSPVSLGAASSLRGALAVAGGSAFGAEDMGHGAATHSPASPEGVGAYRRGPWGGVPGLGAPFDVDGGAGAGVGAGAGADAGAGAAAAAGSPQHHLVPSSAGLPPSVAVDSPMAMPSGQPRVRTAASGGTALATTGTALLPEGRQGVGDRNAGSRGGSSKHTLVPLTFTQARLRAPTRRTGVAVHRPPVSYTTGPMMPLHDHTSLQRVKRRAYDMATQISATLFAMARFIQAWYRGERVRKRLRHLNHCASQLSRIYRCSRFPARV